VPTFDPSAVAIASLLRRLVPAYAPTPVRGLPRLASRLGVAQVLAKDESGRALGSFKSLGGTYAGLRALARAAGQDVPTVEALRGQELPALLCASDGNHGLAVALAAQLAGATATVFLHESVPPARARRIEALGAEVVRVPGTYDAAVAAAADAARAGRGLLVADTTDDPNDPVVRDVMAGYGVMAAELRHDVDTEGRSRPTHVFVQAGVGGLAAAVAEALGGWLAPPAVLVVVEPSAAACVGAALEAGRPVQLAGDLETSASMLSCGRASAPALEILRRHGVRAVSVAEDLLLQAPQLLAETGGPRSTSSGAAGLAGAMAALADPALAAELRLGPESRLLLLVTEGATAGDVG
jgi:diaminopropionate ammonia-lyase